MATHQSLYRYIWQHSRRDQLVILAIAVAAQPFYFLTLSLPKSIVNGPIQGEGFDGEGATRPFLHLQLTMPEWLTGTLSQKWILLEGIDLGREWYLLALSLTFLALVAFNGFLKFLVNTMKGRLGERLLRRLRYELVDRILRFPAAHLRRVKQAEMASMVKDEVEPLGGFTGDAIVWPVFLASQALTALVFIFIQNFWLGLASSLVVAVQGAAIPRLRRPILQLGKMRQLQARELAGRVGEIVDGGSDIRVHGTSNWERADIAGRLGRIFEIRFEIYQRKYFVKALNNFIAQLTPFLFYAVGGYFAIRGQLDVGQLVAVIIAYKDLPGPIKELIDWDMQRQDVEIKYNQVMEQFQPEGMQPVPPQTDGELPAIGEFRFSNVTAVDDAGFVALEDLDLALTLDQSVAVQGPSAGGKEALGYLFARQIQLRTGSATTGIYDLLNMPEHVSGRAIAYAGADAYIFPADLRANLLYGLNLATRRLDPTKAPVSRAVTEAQRTGNPPFDPSADWIDYTPFGSSEPKQVLDRIIATLSLVGLENDIYQIGLQSRLDGSGQRETTRQIVEARTALHARLASPELFPLVERFDVDSFNTNASISENILFGASLDPAFHPVNLANLPHFQRVIAEEGLEEHLVEMGLSIARTMIELFRELPPDHPFFDEFGLIPAGELQKFGQILKRARLSGGTAHADRKQLSALPLRYVEARHRLGIVSPDIRQRIVVARKTFLETLPDELRDRFFSYSKGDYNPAGTLLDNILLGRVAHGMARAQERVSELVRDTLDQLDLRDLIVDAGLAFAAGAGGKRLSTVQRQKLSLARAVIKEPDYLVVNGALANLDEQQKKTIVEGVLRHRRGRGTLWILHSDSLSPLFDRVLTFEHGRLASDERQQEVRGAVQ